MIVGGVDIRWAARLRPEKLRRLYLTDARGILDEELLDEVAYALYARCDSILTVTESIWGETRCPRCAFMIAPGEDGQLLCSECSWRASRAEYHKTWEHQQLNGTNARGIFQEYVHRLPLVRTPQEKMRLIDWLIHQCHVDVRRGTQGRTVAKNLIEGSSRTIRELLEELASGDQA